MQLNVKNWMRYNESSTILYIAGCALKTAGGSTNISSSDGMALSSAMRTPRTRVNWQGNGIDVCPKTSLLWFNLFVKSINLIYAKKLYGNYYEATMKLFHSHLSIFPNPPERESDLRNFPRCYQREKDWWRQQRSAGCQPWRLQNDSSDLHSQRAGKMLEKMIHEWYKHQYSAWDQICYLIHR